MSSQIFRNYNQPWPTWSEIPHDVRDAWFREFLTQFKWLPDHEADLKKAYNHKGSRWLSEKLYKLRNNRGKQDWIQQEIADQLIQRWASDEKFKMKSEKNKLNRAKMDGPSYAGGSIPISEHRRKIAESGDVPEGMIDWTTFERTHSQQDSEGGGKRWINAKSQQFAETFQKLANERDSQSECDPASSQSDNTDIFIEAAGGFNKKGRLFGMGASASRLKPTKRSSSSSEEGVSSDELKRMKALVQELQQRDDETQLRLSQQENELQQTREMMRQMQLTLMSIMKGKGSGPAPGDVDHPGDDDDDHNAAV